MIRAFILGPALLAMYIPFCGTQTVRPAMQPPGLPPASLWSEPIDLRDRDLFYGPWGPERAPDPGAEYTLIERKHSGVNPGMTVRDPRGREWFVKQAANDERPDEGPVEVVVSRLLSAAGYHQPPIYYLPQFTLKDDWGRHTEAGGRFGLMEPTLKVRGGWSLQQNPFVGTQPYNGLLAILMMLNATDLKNSNNMLFEHATPDGAEYWYTLLDLGSALGSTGRFAPAKNDIIAFERHGFITGISHGFVQFAYKGFHQELIRDRITAADVAWASELLGSLSQDQWDDAFRAGGYPAPLAARFITVLQQKIETGRRLADAGETGR